MKRILRIMMTVLSYSPIATVAIAAHAKANELDGEVQNEQITEKIVGARYRLLQPYQMISSIDAARTRYAQVTGLEGIELDKAMTKDIKALMKAGLLQLNEKYLRAMGPSEHSSGQ